MEHTHQIRIQIPVSSFCVLVTYWSVACTALAYHNAQLQASAFREEFDPDSFEDLTEANIGQIHKVGAVQLYLPEVPLIVSI